MASKRKRESDEYSELSAKISKSGDDIPSHSRSGRARKKPARFMDEEDGDESPTEGQEGESKTEEILEVKHTPTLIAATPQIISSTPQLIMAAPQIISAAPQLINATQLMSVAPHLINSSPQLINSSPQLISSSPQLLSSTPQLIGSGPQLITAPSQLIASASQVIAGAPQMIVTQEPLIQPKVEASETPKSSRIKRKSKADIQRDYRARKKLREGENYLNKERARVKGYYVPIAEQSKTKANERRKRGREAMRRHREKLKMESSQNSTQDSEITSTIEASSMIVSTSEASSMIVKLPVIGLRHCTRRRVSGATCTANCRRTIERLRKENRKLSRKLKTISNRYQRLLSKTKATVQAEDSVKPNANSVLTPRTSTEITEDFSP